MSAEQLIEKFCDTLDTKYLAKLQKEYQIMFQKSSVRAMKEKKANKKVAKKVLQYFNLNEDGTRKFDNPGTRDKGEGELFRMSIGCTGARKGDILTGTHKGTKGALLQVHNDVPPSEKILNRMRPFIDIWSQFLIKLGGIPFFSNMSIEEREMWLDINENDNDFFAAEDRLQLMQPGIGDSVKKQGSIFVAFLPEEELSKLMAENPDSDDGFWSPKEIDETVIEYTGKTSTLVVLKTFWKISTTYTIVKHFDGPLLDIKKGTVENGGDTEEGKEIIVVGNIVKKVKKVGKGKTIRWEKTSEQDAGFLVSKSRFNLQKSIDVAKSIMEVDMEEFNEATIGFTAASHKSLLQKIIRFMPKMIDLGDGNLKSGDSVLLACLSTLMAHPGAFVPNIQRFVSGLESCAKRVAVSIYEDSSIPLEQVDKLYRLLAGAFLAQRVKEWRPTKKLVKEWFETALIGYNDHTGYIVDNNGEITKEPYVLKAGQHILKNSSAILDELRSFPGDLGLARGWARDYPDIERSEAKYQPEIMPLEHCIDQHWAPSVVYYYDPEVVMEEGEKNDWHKKSLTAKSSTPFGPLFINIFSKVTGVNPRFPRGGVHYTPKFESIPFVEETRNAQRLFRMALQAPQTMRKSKGTTTLDYELHTSWLAGLVGVMTIKVKGAVTIVTMKADDPLELVVARQPKARRGKTSYQPLTPEQEEEAIVIAKDRLRKGVCMNQATAPDKSLEGCKVYLVESKDEPFYEVRKGGVKKEWDEARFVKVQLDIHKKISWSIEKALTRIGNGVEKDYENRIEELLDSTDKKVLQRTLIYISTANSEIEMHHISRDGGGTGKTVNLYDVPAYQLLLRISLIAPGALRPIEGKPATFSVPNGPLLWTIRAMMLKKTEKKISKKDIEGWGVSRFADDRKMFDYQEETVDDMIKNNNEGLKGQFLWLPVGTGKCVHPDTPVLMWDGSTKIAKDIKAGDLLIGDNNTPRKVLSTCKGVDNMYKIKQNKGDDYVVNEPHILTLKYSGHKGWLWEEQYNRYKMTWFDPKNVEEKQQIFTATKRQFNLFETKDDAFSAALEYNKEVNGRVFWVNNTCKCLWIDSDDKKHTKSFTVSNIPIPGYESKEEAYKAMVELMYKIPDEDGIIDIPVRDYIKLRPNLKKQLKGFKTGVEFEYQPVFIDPYVLGMWLGDGHRTGFGFTNMDEECVKYFDDYLRDMDCMLIKRPNNEITYGIRGIKKSENFFQHSLDFYNLRKNKHIPRDFLVNCREIRLQLLAGLIDTDGYLSNGCYEITQKRKTLSENICYLARSLGFHVTYTEVKKSCIYKGEKREGIYYKCLFSGSGIEDIPCKIGYKKANIRKQKKDVLVTSIEVEPLGKGEYCGFMLDGNGRFLLGDFTVTHNTKIVLTYLSHLKENNKLPKYIIYTLPPESVMSIIEEVRMFGVQVNVMIPLQSIGDKRKEFDKIKVSVTKGCEPKPYHINLILHDHLRRCEETLPKYAGDSIIIFDEVHLFLNQSLRTGMGMNLSHLSRAFISFTGTPVIDNKTEKLISWLEQIVPFEVNKRNFWVAANNMIAKKITTGIKTEHEDIVAPFDVSEQLRYQRYVPPAMGGTNTNPSSKDWMKAADICYEACDRKMVDLTNQLLKKGRGVMIVAKDTAHQNKLKEMVLRKTKLTDNDIFLIEKDKSIFLTDESVKKKKTPDYKVVIVTKRKAQGYTLTRLSVMITSVYPSNNATIEQLKGRINRLGQKTEPLLYYTVHIGILTSIMENHEKASSLSAALQAIAEKK